jgi:hypothetical protein
MDIKVTNYKYDDGRTCLEHTPFSVPTTASDAELAVCDVFFFSKKKMAPAFGFFSKKKKKTSPATGGPEFLCKIFVFTGYLTTYKHSVLQKLHKQPSDSPRARHIIMPQNFTRKKEETTQEDNCS